MVSVFPVYNPSANAYAALTYLTGEQNNLNQRCTSLTCSLQPPYYYNYLCQTMTASS